MRALGLGRLGLGTQCLGLGAKRLGLGHLALFNNSVNVRHSHHIFRSNRNVNEGQWCHSTWPFSHFAVFPVRRFSLGRFPRRIF